jgi:hypothetical protein
LISIGVAKSNEDTSRQVRRSSVLALVHVPQLVSCEDATSNDSSLDEGNDNGTLITSHSDALDSVEDYFSAGGRLSDGDWFCRDTSVYHSKNIITSEASYQQQVQ